MKKTVVCYAVILLALPLLIFGTAKAATSSGSTGLEATVKGNPPTQAPTISIPSNGQSFSVLPVTVSGLCQNGLLVEVFKNDVFAGARDCSGGTYSIQIDLFSGANVLVARQFDALDQASPDSNSVTVNFNNSLPSTGPLISITSEFAKRGANPGSILTWPITLSGGTGPYAITVDWGDSSPPDLISEQFPGNITLQHIYKTAGTYNITIKASDKNGNLAFLQVVGIGNGAIQQTNAKGNTNNLVIERQVPLWAFLVFIAATITSFWLGKRHQVQTIRARLRAGEPPFGRVKRRK